MGVITGGQITVYKLINGVKSDQVGEPVISDENGNFDLTTVAELYDGAVMLELTDPDGSTLYFNEAEGEMIAFPDGKSLRAVVSQMTGNAVAITPLTEVATQLALHLVSAESLADGEAVTRANREVSNALLGGIDPTDTIPVDVRRADAASSNNAAVYANVLAGIAFVAQRNGIDPIAQADIYAQNLINNNAQFLQNDLGDLILAIANFNTSPPDNVVVPNISLDIAPVAYGQTVVIDEDQTTDITLHGGDLNRLPVMFAIETQPSNGRLTGTPPNLTYEPNGDYNGQDSFYFMVNNGFQNSERTLVNIVINSVEDAPVASDSVLLTAENEPGSGTLRGSDPDADSITYSVVSNPTLGIISSINQETGEFVYVPNTNVSGSDSFTFQVSDGTNTSNIATMNITIRNVNSQPSATAQVLTLDEDASLNISLGGTDADGDPLAVVLTSSPQHGILEGTLPDIIYKPDPDYSGPDSFGFYVTDGALDSGVAAVSLQVVQVNDAPRAFNRSVSLEQGSSITFVLDGDDKEEDPLSYTITTLPTNGILGGATSGALANMSPLQYTPDSDFSGTDQFGFELSDGNGGVATGVVTIEVLPYAQSTIDSDGDGLRDADEVNVHKTNPLLADTDGDGFSDFEEVVTFAFDSSVNNFRFNPLIADTPKISMSISATPYAFVQYYGTSYKSFELERSVSSSSAITKEKSSKQVSGLSKAYELGRELTIAVQGTDINSQSGSGGAFIAANYPQTFTTTSGHATLFSEESLNENQLYLKSLSDWERDNVIADSVGSIKFDREFTNNSNLSYKLNNITYRLYSYNPSQNQPFVEIGKHNTFVGSTLSPGQSSSVTEENIFLQDIERVKRAFKDSKGFIVVPENYDITDQNGLTYNFSSTGILSKDVMFMIDYNGMDGRKNIKEMIAVHGDPSQKLTLLGALSNILKLDVTTAVNSSPTNSKLTSGDYITSIDGLADSYPTGSWVIIHGKQQGNNTITTRVYTSPSVKAAWDARGTQTPGNLVDAFNSAAFELNGGDVVQLIYLRDEDSDGVTTATEYFYSSDPYSDDSDGDSLTDAEEINGWQVSFTDDTNTTLTRHVVSDPTIQDTDGDGLNDNLEANLFNADFSLRRDPSSKDTDGDTIPDDVDDFSGAVLSSSAFDSMQLEAFTSTFPGTNTDMTVNYTLPTALQAADLGVGTYKLVLLRQIRSTTDPVFVEPDSYPTNGWPFLVGDDVTTADTGTSCTAATCWTVVHVADYTPGSAPISDSFTTSSDTSNQLASGETAKFIAYIGIDGVYHRLPYDVVVSSAQEQIRVVMSDGTYSNKVTLIGSDGDPIGRNVGTNYVEGNVIYNANFSGTTYTGSPLGPYTDSYYQFARAWGAPYYDFQYTRYDSALASQGGVYIIPKIPAELVYNDFNHINDVLNNNRKGDGQLDLLWYLYVAGVRVNTPTTHPIGGSYDQLAPSAPRSGPTTNSDTFLDVFGDDVPTVITKPSLEACYYIRQYLYEKDATHSSYWNYTTSTTGTYVSVCRDNGADGVGIWTVADVNTGEVYGATRADNPNPVKVPVSFTWEPGENFYSQPFGKPPTAATVNTTMEVHIDP
ncbi:MAG: tandem-95 repeat protein [Gammaproteobacteria bacterium]|nr:tandem-95 repeat protein [Gammaproteobacteria bacterium]